MLPLPWRSFCVGLHPAVDPVCAGVLANSTRIHRHPLPGGSTSTTTNIPLFCLGPVSLTISIMACPSRPCEAFGGEAGRTSLRWSFQLLAHDVCEAAGKELKAHRDADLTPGDYVL